jgi:energy-coupling factor transporter ATP-binding protein EcfA2
MRLRPFSSQERGMFISIDGPSGAGKSTIVRHLAQLLVAAGENVQARPGNGMDALSDSRAWCAPTRHVNPAADTSSGRRRSTRTTKAASGSRATTATACHTSGPSPSCANNRGEGRRLGWVAEYRGLGPRADTCRAARQVPGSVREVAPQVCHTQVLASSSGPQFQQPVCRIDDHWTCSRRSRFRSLDQARKWPLTRRRQGPPPGR